MSKQRTGMFGAWSLIMAVLLIVTLLSFKASSEPKKVHPVNPSPEPSRALPATTVTSTSTTLRPQRVEHAQVLRANRGSTRTHRGYASAEECISMVENGGNYGRSSNPNHFGRYQFDHNAWKTYGGDPKDWGTASPAEQDQVFRNAMNAGAHQRWTPYNGC